MSSVHMIQEQPLDTQYDIAIAGGGMVGASLALLLSVYSGRRLKILLVENFPLKREAHSVPVYSPSFDARATALSYGSRVIFEACGVWPLLQQHAEPIDSIHVSQRGKFGSTLMDKSEVEWPALGYVVENTWLGGSLLAALSQHDNVVFAAPAAVKAIRPASGNCELDIDSDGHLHTSACRLVVVADGANSGLRQQLGIAVRVNDYGRQSLIANVGLANSHGGRAFERFTEQGPLALLPLSDSPSGEPRAALVWTLPPERAQELVAADDEIFLAALQQCFGHRLGKLTRVGERVVYPLKLIEAEEQLRHRVVVMGNAAHSLHPVAGQGFNLALRDCAVLTEVLCDAVDQSVDADIGALALLREYGRRQQSDQHITIGFSDRLPALFASRQWPLSALRGLGLGMLDIVPALKMPFVRQAAGMFDGAPLGLQR